MNKELEDLVQQIVASLRYENYGNTSYLISNSKLCEKEDRPNIYGKYNYFTLKEKKIFVVRYIEKEPIIFENWYILNDFYFYYLNNHNPKITGLEKIYLQQELVMHTLLLAKKIIPL